MPTRTPTPDLSLPLAYPITPASHLVGELVHYSIQMTACFVPVTLTCKPPAPWSLLLATLFTGTAAEQHGVAP
jgi:hypothetical protein